MLPSARRRWRAPVVISAAAALAAAPIAVAPAVAAPEDPATIQILDINDFHGRIQESGSVLAGAVDAERDADVDDTVFVSAGDNIGASTFTSFSQEDEPTIDVLNAMDLQVSAVGNHEFDRGLADLTGRVADLADFPYLGANVYEAGTDTPALQEFEVVVTESGLRIGFVGVVTQQTPSLVTPSGIAGLTFGDPAEALSRVAEQLKDDDAADIVVGLVHEGATTSFASDDSAEEIGRAHV